MWGGIFVIEFNHFICEVANLNDFVTLCKLAFWLNVVTLDMKWHIIWLNLVIYDCLIISMEKIKLNNLIPLDIFCVMEPLSLDQLILLNSNHQPPSGVLMHPQAPWWTQLWVQRWKQQKEKELGCAPWLATLWG